MIHPLWWVLQTEAFCCRKKWRWTPGWETEVEHCLEGQWNLWKQSPLSAMPLHTNQYCQLLNTEVYTKIKEYKWQYSLTTKEWVGLFKVYCAISSHLGRLYWYLIESHELLGMHFVPWAYNIHLSVFKPLWFHFSYTQQVEVYQLPTSETYENQSGLGLLCDVWLRIYNSWTLIKAVSSQ